MFNDLIDLLPAGFVAYVAVALSDARLTPPSSAS